jgi:hypothetical protein
MGARGLALAATDQQVAAAGGNSVNFSQILLARVYRYPILVAATLTLHKLAGG